MRNNPITNCTTILASLKFTLSIEKNTNASSVLYYAYHMQISQQTTSFKVNNVSLHIVTQLY